VIKQIGGFDERFSVNGRLGGYEDNDYSLRSNIAGFRNVISCRSVVLHESHQAWRRNNLDFWEKQVQNSVEYQTKYWDLLVSLQDRIKTEEIFIPFSEKE
jgi:GT2 family glycosyltransferase